MPRTGRPRRDGRSGLDGAIQDLFDKQYTRVFNRLNARDTGLLPTRRQYLKRLIRAKRRLELSCELNGETTDFAFRK